MPELPEVETIKEDLKNIIKGKRVEKIEVRLAKAIKNASGERFVQELKGDTFKSLSRRGKYLIFSLKSGRSLIIHLGMTGRLIYSKVNPVRSPPILIGGTPTLVGVTSNGVNEEISDYNQKFSWVIFTLLDSKPREMAATPISRGKPRRMTTKFTQRGKRLTLLNSRHLTKQVEQKHLTGFTLDKGILRFVDMRGFGGIYLIPKGGLERFSRLTDLGPEPLSREFTPQVFKNLLKKHKASPVRSKTSKTSASAKARTSNGARIKPLLLNQQFLAGLGNIYSLESLYRARISPLRRADSLSGKEVKRLHSAIQKVLIGAIASHGASIDASYVDAKGRKGSYQFKLKVYRREGERCSRCGGIIKRIKQNNRSTYFCPECQR